MQRKPRAKSKSGVRNSVTKSDTGFSNRINNLDHNKIRDKVIVKQKPTKPTISESTKPTVSKSMEPAGRTESKSQKVQSRWKPRETPS